MIDQLAGMVFGLGDRTEHRAIDHCADDQIEQDIGIGGFAIKHIQPSEYGYVRRLVQYANSCGVRVHGLGYTKKDAVSFGFYSVDSTTWTTQVNFGGLSYFNGSEMVVVRPPKGMIGADYRRRREYSLREWIKYQKYLDTKGKWRG